MTLQNRANLASLCADGSARMFDLRHLNHSTIVYEDPNKEKLQRLSWNKQEHYFLALFAENSQEVQILDIRMPCSILCRLKNHNGPVNGIAWAPHSPHHICTAGDDSQALIWDLQHAPRPVEDPILAYTAGGEVNQIHWGPVHSNWIAICFNKTLEILRV
uniref:WD_REPEATS_REGION domain-containing protein n=1 Tax=Caenorhabditis japonica TaxID=281687 RepID=A0A8R1ECJ4_CAEJA